MLLMLPLGKVFDREVEDWCGSVWYSFSQGSLGDEWSSGSRPMLPWEEWWLEPMSACVSFASMGLQMLLVGEGKLCRAIESSLSLGESTITASGSSCGRDCLLVFIRLKAAWRKRKNLLLPDKWKEVMWSLVKFLVYSTGKLKYPTASNHLWLDNSLLQPKTYKVYRPMRSDKILISQTHFAKVIMTVQPVENYAHFSDCFPDYDRLLLGWQFVPCAPLQFFLCSPTQRQQSHEKCTGRSSVVNGSYGNMFANK